MFIMNESRRPSTPIETVIASTRAESPHVSDSSSEEPSHVEDRGYVREQLFRARALEDMLTQTLVSECIKAGDTAAANELILRTQAEHNLREGATKEIVRVRDRKDADLTLSFTIDSELAGIQDDGSEENRSARRDIEARAIEARTLRSEVQKIEVNDAQSGKITEAVFKPQDGEPHVLVHGQDAGTLTNHLPRGHLREWLAGFVAKSFGVDRVVPPTVIREVKGCVGSVQEWVKGEPAVSHLDWAQKAQLRDMEAVAILDYVLENADRHISNFLIDNEGHIFAIDHGAILSLKKENGALRSFPLRVVSGKPISEEAAVQMQILIDSRARMQALEEAFAFVLGEDAGQKFAQFKDRLQLLASDGRFPKYSLAYSEDEAHFSLQGDNPDKPDVPVTGVARTAPGRQIDTSVTVVGAKKQAA